MIQCKLIGFHSSQLPPKWTSMISPILRLYLDSETEKIDFFLSKYCLYIRYIYIYTFVHLMTCFRFVTSKNNNDKSFIPLRGLQKKQERTITVLFCLDENRTVSCYPDILAFYPFFVFRVTHCLLPQLVKGHFVI